MMDVATFMSRAERHCEGGYSSEFQTWAPRGDTSLRPLTHEIPRGEHALAPQKKKYVQPRRRHGRMIEPLTLKQLADREADVLERREQARDYAVRAERHSVLQVVARSLYSTVVGNDSAYVIVAVDVAKVTPWDGVVRRYFVVPG